MSNNNTPSKAEAPEEWDGRCVLGHCGSPSGCEHDMRCRADAGAPDAANAGEPVAETPAELALRSLASWLGVGGYNAPTVDAEVFEKKIREGVSIYSQAHGLAARDLAEQVLSMSFVTPKALRAKELARRVIGILPFATPTGVAADESTRAPDGWKLVPLEPTDAMFQAWLAKDSEPVFDFPEAYRAMLDAAPPSGERPSAPAPEGEK